MDVADADVSALMVKWSDDVASRAAGGVAEEIWCPEPGCVYSMHPGEGRTLKALKGLLTVFNHVCLKHVPEHLWTDICVCSKRCPTAKALKSHESTCAEAGGSAFAFKCKCGKDFKKQAAFDKHVAKMTRCARLGKQRTRLRALAASSPRSRARLTRAHAQQRPRQPGARPGGVRRRGVKCVARAWRATVRSRMRCHPPQPADSQATVRRKATREQDPDLPARARPPSGGVRACGCGQLCRGTRRHWVGTLAG